MAQKLSVSRRSILKTGLGTAVAAGFPAIVPSSVFGRTAPSNRINIGAIGVGRISRVHDLPAIRKVPYARIIAVCDLDSNRVEQAKTLVNGYYSAGNGVTGYRDYHELLANKDVDAAVISTPDHQHAVLAVSAVRAGKDVYLQKPASLTISEGRQGRSEQRAGRAGRDYRADKPAISLAASTQGSWGRNGPGNRRNWRSRPPDYFQYPAPRSGRGVIWNPHAPSWCNPTGDTRS